MNYELRAILLMLGALRLELRANSLAQKGTGFDEIDEVWGIADMLATGSGEVLRDADKQEAEAKG